MLLALAVCLSAATGCGDDGPTRYSVSGKVQLDGEPLQRGSILFVPIEDTEGPKAAGRIENGSYQIPVNAGPLAGTYRVEIRAEKDLDFALDDPRNFDAKAPRKAPENPVPPQYNRRSTLTAQVTADGPNEFNFDLKTKKPQ